MDVSTTAKQTRAEQCRKNAQAKSEQKLRGKQREIDRLYGKLAAASPITDAELRSAFASALDCLAQQER